MFQAFPNKVVIMFMLIAFVGQAFTYSAMFCAMTMDANDEQMHIKHSTGPSHQGMGHMEMKSTSITSTSIKSMPMENMNAHHSEDCCGPDCVCPASACSATTVLNTNLDLVDIQLISETIVTLPFQHPKSIQTSFFRPPIFA